MTLELAVERHIDAPVERVWQVMTERIAEWFVPAPWYAEVIEQDWRPGGRDAMMFRGPDGEEMPQEGVFLEVVPGKRFVSTDAFTHGWAPSGPFMVGTWSVEADGTGTRYRGTARHWSQEDHDKHQSMGFEFGWGAAADQLKRLCEDPRLMSFQAYLDTIEAKTGKNPADLRAYAAAKGFTDDGVLRAGVKAGAIVADLKAHLGLRHGHAMAVVALLKGTKKEGNK